MLNVAMPKLGLQRASVMPLIGQCVATGVSEICGCALKANMASLPACSTIRPNPAVLEGAMRSDVNTNGDFGFC